MCLTTFDFISLSIFLQVFSCMTVWTNTFMTVLLNTEYIHNYELLSIYFNSLSILWTYNTVPLGILTKPLGRHANNAETHWERKCFASPYTNYFVHSSHSPSILNL